MASRTSLEGSVTETLPRPAHAPHVTLTLAFVDSTSVDIVLTVLRQVCQCQRMEDSSAANFPTDRLIADIVRGVSEGEFGDEDGAIVHLCVGIPFEPVSAAWAAVQSCVDVLSAKAGKHGHGGAL